MSKEIEGFDQQIREVFSDVLIKLANRVDVTVIARAIFDADEDLSDLESRKQRLQGNTEVADILSGRSSWDEPHNASIHDAFRYRAGKACEAMVSEMLQALKVGRKGVLMGLDNEITDIPGGLREAADVAQQLRRGPPSADLNNLAADTIMSLCKIPKPIGEVIYGEHVKRVSAGVREAELDGEECGTVEEMIEFVERWLPDALPASLSGQVHFARALCESLIEAVKKHLERHPVEYNEEKPAPNPPADRVGLGA